MKKRTINTIITAFIAVFMVSSIFFYGSQGEQSEGENVMPDKLIYLEELPENTELSFVRQGFTVAKYYYPALCVECGPFIQELENTVMNRLDQQLVLERLQVESFNKTLPYMHLKSLKSIEEIEGLKNMTQFYDKACLVLLQPPPECISP